jgi:hypothetical protein
MSVAAIVFSMSLVDEIYWYFAYHYAYSFDSINYLYNTRHACGMYEAPTDSKIPEPGMQTWDSVISTYQNSAHSGWIVSQPSLSLGLCNRILDISSLFILAIATNRTLWIEWDMHVALSDTGQTVIGIESFDQLFDSPLHDPRFKPPHSVRTNETYQVDKACLLHGAATSPDLNRDLMHDKEVAISAGCDWWGGLLLKNPHYKHTIFKGLNFTTGFPVLFRSLFKLRPPIPQPVECSWLIQYRSRLSTTRWRKHPIDRFIECAMAKGMSHREFRSTWIVTDDKDALIESASPQSKRLMSIMNLPADEERCEGQCGNRYAMETMYRLTQCKHAVLSFGSSFGSCITSLAGIKDIYRVGRFGECHEMPSDEPTDMNTVSRYGNTATFMSTMNP